MWHILKADFSQPHTILFLFLLPLGTTLSVSIKQPTLTITQWLLLPSLFAWPYIWLFFHTHKNSKINILTRLPIPHYRLGIRRLLILNTWGILAFLFLIIFFFLPNENEPIQWIHLLFIHSLMLIIYALLLITQDIQHTKHQLSVLHKYKVYKFFEVCCITALGVLTLGTALSLNPQIGINSHALLTTLFQNIFVASSTTITEACTTSLVGLALSLISLFTFKQRSTYMD